MPPWCPFGGGLIPAADIAPGGHPSAVGHPRRLAPLSLTTLSKVMLPSRNGPQPNTDWPRDVNAYLGISPHSRQICRLISSSESLLPLLRPPLSQLSSLCLILLPAHTFSFSSVDPKSMPSELASMQKSISAAASRRTQPVTKKNFPNTLEYRILIFRKHLLPAWQSRTPLWEM